MAGPGRSVRIACTMAGFGSWAANAASGSCVTSPFAWLNVGFRAAVGKVPTMDLARIGRIGNIAHRQPDTLGDVQVLPAQHQTFLWMAMRGWRSIW